MESNRREFIRAALAGGALVAAGSGCVSLGGACAGDGSLVDFTVPPMKRIRMGFIGLGERGMAGFHRVMLFPGVEAAAICDLRAEAVDDASTFLRKWELPGCAHEYKGSDEIWRGVCEDSEVDAVYIVTPQYLHAQMELYALACGKHVLCEVPGAETIKDCWRIVEAAEKAQRHCYLLENRCFREPESLALSLAKQGVLGDLAYAEAAYIHNLNTRQLADNFRNRQTKERGRLGQNWCTYPTHPLGPICRYFDINSGDRMTTLVTMAAGDFVKPAFARDHYGLEEWQNKLAFTGSDMITTLIKTARGRTIEIKQSFGSPRPYTRINFLGGTKGCFQGEPFELFFADKAGEETGSWFNDARRTAAAERYRHPLWNKFGPAVKELGSLDRCTKFFSGHGGVDYIMEMSWIHSLRNGRPMPQNVYDLATWSSIIELSRQSVEDGSRPVEVPDFTRGAWAKNDVSPLVDFDAADIGLDLEAFKSRAKLWAGV